jgi:hypothetical protein
MPTTCQGVSERAIGHCGNVARGAVRRPDPDDAASHRRQVEGGDVTAIFLLIPGLVFALAAAGIVWIRLATAEYRHKWSAPQEESQGAYARR